MKLLLQILEKIYIWWADEGPTYSARYESKIYPEGVLPKLTGEFFERDGDERKGWLKLFILACTYTMSWSDLEKQKSFLNICQQRGWLDIFSNPNSSADEWIDVLESYLSGQIEEAKWYLWMRQFVNIYQVSKDLDDYVNNFLSIEDRPGPISLNTIMRPGADAEMDRGGYGYNTPTVSRTIGIGACFIVRELVRMGILTKEHVFPHCYVPIKRVRYLFAEEFGCKKILTEPKLTASKVMHDFLINHLGKERATFSLSFDLPFLALTDNPIKKHEILRSCTQQ